MVRILETGAELKDAALVAILIHGRARTADEMIAFAGALGVAGVRYLAPQAHAGSWYPGRFMDAVACNQPDLDRSLGILEAMVRDLLATGVGAERIVLCGFSQGACLALHSLVSSPRAYAGVVALTGGLIGPAGTEWPAAPEIAGMPVLLTGSEVDDWVPAARARESAAWLSAQRARVDLVIYADRAHEMSADEIERTAALLRGALSGAPSTRGAYWR